MAPARSQSASTAAHSSRRQGLIAIVASSRKPIRDLRPVGGARIVEHHWGIRTTRYRRQRNATTFRRRRMTPTSLTSPGPLRHHSTRYLGPIDAAAVRAVARPRQLVGYVLQ